MSVATVSQNAVVDGANSSSTVLGAAGAFTGRAEDVSIYAAVNVFAFADQAGTLFVEFSVDGTNWDKSNSFAVTASTASIQSLAPSAQFVRVRYVNGATPQTVFRLQTFYQPLPPAAPTTVTVTPLAVGLHANAWNAAAVGVNGVSNSVDCQYVDTISIFGNVNGNTTISVQESQDNVNFYDTDTLAITNGGGNFGIRVESGARYLRLKSSQARTITATIAGKG